MAGSVHEGVNIGPLDPNKAENFGQVAGSNVAKLLIRQHAAAHPPQLVAALSRKESPARTRAIDHDEVLDVIDASIPEGERLEGFEVTGYQVRGEERQQQFLAYTFEVSSKATPDGTRGTRSGKGYLPYDADTFPLSFEAGDRAVAIEKAKKDGRPWGAIEGETLSGQGEGLSIAAQADLIKSVQELSDQVAELRDRLDAEPDDDEDDEGDEGEDDTQLGGDQPPVTGGTLVAPGAPEGVQPPASTEPEASEPFEGYDQLNADDVLKRVQADPSIARRVATYEVSPKGGQRSSLTRRVEGIAAKFEAEQQAKAEQDAAGA